MYYAAKFLEATGLGLLAFGFLRSFPNKINYNVFAVSIIFFVCGWIMERYLLKR